MFVSKRAYRAAQEDILRLRREFEQAQASLARYKDQEHELLDALVSARTEARQMRQVADAQARELVDRARAEADNVEAEARSQVAVAKSEVERLKDVQRELSVSLQQSLAVLGSVLTQTAETSELAGGAAAPTTRVPEPAPPALEPAPAPLAPSLANQRQAERTPVPAPRDTRRFKMPTIPSWSNQAGRFSRIRKTYLGAAAVVLLAVFALLAGMPARWRGSNRANPSSVSRTAPISHAGGTGAGASTRASRPVAADGARSSSPLTVALRAVRPLWLRADVDGSTAVARLVRAGEQLDLHGTREVIVRAGDAGALLMSVNGRARSAFGRDGAVLTRRITAATGPTGDTPTPALRVLAREPARPLLTPAVPAARQEPRPSVPEALPVTTQQPFQAAATAPHAEPPPPAIEPIPPLPSRSSPAPRSEEEADVLRGHEAYFEALSRGDTGGVARLATGGFSASGGPAEDAGSPHEIALGSTKIEVRGIGAVVSGTATRRIRGPDGRHAGDQPLLFSEVWIKENGEWQLMNVRFANSTDQR